MRDVLAAFVEGVVHGFDGPIAEALDRWPALVAGVACFANGTHNLVHGPRAWGVLDVVIAVLLVFRFVESWRGGDDA